MSLVEHPTDLISADLRSGGNSPWFSLILITSWEILMSGLFDSSAFTTIVVAAFALGLLLLGNRRPARATLRRRDPN